jgi:AcrR family transcriptional regulator
LQAARRRPGPRVDVDVPTILLDAAEREFGTGQFEAVSLRTVAKAAGVAPAAVSYHYGSKQNLVEAVIWRRLRPLRETLLGRLTSLAASKKVSPRQLVDAILSPFVDALNADPEGAIAWMKLYTSFALSQNEIWHSQAAGDVNATQLFTSIATRALPDFEDPAVMRRAGIAMYSMLTTLASAEAAAYGPALTADGLDPQFVEQLARFTTAGLVGKGGVRAAPR